MCNRVEAKLATYIFFNLWNEILVVVVAQDLWLVWQPMTHPLWSNLILFNNFIPVAWPKFGQRGIDYYTTRKNLSFRSKEWEWKGELDILSTTRFRSPRFNPKLYDDPNLSSSKILIIRKKLREQWSLHQAAPSIRLLRRANNNGTEWKIDP